MSDKRPGLHPWWAWPRFWFEANNFSGTKSELSIVSIVKLYKVTPVHLGYHFQYLQYYLQLQAGA